MKKDHRPGIIGDRTTRLFAVGLLSVLVACSGASQPEVPRSSTATAEVVAIASTAQASASWFTATMSGDREMRLEGEAVLAGVKYKRYHINMASKDPEKIQPTVVIAFGNTDTIAPGPGVYPLSGRTGFRGSVEIYGSPQQDFQITGGELIITEANGDVLTGSFKLKAKETPEEYGDPSALIGVEGKFVSRSAGR